MKSRVLSAFLISMLLSPIVYAREESRHWCGTRGPQQTEYFIKQHEFRKQDKRLRPLSKAQLNSVIKDVGEIAVVKATPVTLISPNQFDLKGKKITFTRVPSGGYNMKIGNGSVSANQGEPISLTDDDFRLYNFTSGFSFTFYGTTYNSVFINSDGNLTFREGDEASTARDVFRVLTGPARIAPFFTDLNPQVRGQVKLLQTSSKLTITWNDVSEYLNSGTNSNTFQINLLKNGNFEFIYSTRIDTRGAIVGICPGNTSFSNLRLINYSGNTNVTGIRGAILERFATAQEVDFTALINQFHQTHDDIFDFVVIWSDFPVNLGPGAFAFYSGIQNNIRGIGQPVYNFSRAFGSNKIQGFLAMGFLGRYPDDPDQEFLFSNSTLEVFGQENGHRWLAFPRVSITGQPQNLLLGRDESHWSFYMDTDASCMEGNDIRDNGNGTFTTIQANETFSKLDRYIMGFLPPGAVPRTFVVTGNSDSGRPPEPGVEIRGTKVEVSVQDIIRFEGPRVPKSSQSQKKFREAFILFTRNDNPNQAMLNKLEQIRKGWTAFWRKETGNKSTMDTTLP